jgi:hypothetical protein
MKEILKKILITVIFLLVMFLFNKNAFCVVGPISAGTLFEFDASSGVNPVLSQIDSTHYLAVYTGLKTDGWAVVLTVDTGTGLITKETAFEFDAANGEFCSIEKIDTTHYLVVYQGNRGDGFAVILTVNIITWAITSGTSFEFETKDCVYPDVVKIDSLNYLVAYEGNKGDGWATILTVDLGTDTVTQGTPFEFDTADGNTPSLEQIDATHYLLAYAGVRDDGWASILTVNTGTGIITQGTPFEFNTVSGFEPDLSQIDSTHYLLAYRGAGLDATAVILTVNTVTDTITQGTPFIFDPISGYTPSISAITSTEHLVAFRGNGDGGWAVVLTADTGTGTITMGTEFEYDGTAGYTPNISQIDSSNYLVVYSGSGNDGWSVILSISTGFYLNGTYTSGVKDAGVVVSWDKISWSEVIPTNTDLQFQVRSGNTNPPTGSFVGPDGTSGTYFTDFDGPTGTGTDINVTDNRYFQYIAYFTTTDAAVTPELSSVTITYSLSGGNVSGTYIYDWEET